MIFQGPFKTTWTSVTGLLKQLPLNSFSGCNCNYIRWCTLRFVIQSLLFRLFSFMLVIVDSFLIVADIIIDCPPTLTSRIIEFIELGISSIFFLEVGIRIFALSPKGEKGSFLWITEEGLLASKDVWFCSCSVFFVEALVQHFGFCHCFGHVLHFSRLHHCYWRFHRQWSFSERNLWSWRRYWIFEFH